MLKYLTGLQLVGFGQAFPDSSNHFAHERIVFQAHSPRNGLFKLLAVDEKSGVAKFTRVE